MLIRLTSVMSSGKMKHSLPRSAANFHPFKANLHALFCMYFNVMQSEQQSKSEKCRSNWAVNIFNLYHFSCYSRLTAKAELSSRSTTEIGKAVLEGGWGLSRLTLNVHLWSLPQSVKMFINHIYVKPSCNLFIFF